jgi:DNA helicase TIP49 (TBP-interacting protein)
MEDNITKEVTKYIDKNIEKWISNGFTPCMKTFIEMEQSVFLDVNTYQFKSILKRYCEQNNILFRKNKLRVERKTVTCFLLSKK